MNSFKQNAQAVQDVSNSAGLQRRMSALSVLSGGVGILAFGAAFGGLFWPSGADTEPPTVISVWNDTIVLYGRGLYRHDTVFSAGAAQGADVVTLLFVVPCLFMALRLRRSPLGTMLLSGALAWVFYVYASLALGTVVYNRLFLLYLALFSGSGIALWLATQALYRSVASLAKASMSVPSRGLSVFLLISGGVTAAVWLLPLIPSAASGAPPALLAHYTGRVTDALDLGVIVPLTFTAAILVWHNRPWGYALAIPLLSLEALLLPMIVSQTIRQLQIGVELSPATAAVPIGGFVAISAVSLWFLAKIYRVIRDSDQRCNDAAVRGASARSG